MRDREWMILGVVGLALYAWSKRQAPLPSVSVMPGTVGAPGGALLTLPPGLPSGQARLDAALADALGTPVLRSTPIGVGYMELAPGLSPSVTFDDALTSSESDFGFQVPLDSYQTVPYAGGLA